MATIYDFTQYKDFFNRLIQDLPKAGRGARGKLATSIGCQVAYVTHVLSGNSHFNLEQAEAAGRFFGLTQRDIDYLLILVCFNRAATQELKSVLKRQLEERKKALAPLKERLKLDEKLPIEAQSIYYSHWSFSAIHMALTIPELRTRAALASTFRLPLDKIDAVLNFLIENNLIKKERTEYLAPKGSLHLPKTSPFITHHHTNWRMQAIANMFNEDDDELHYSGIFSIAKSDVAKIKEILVQGIEESLRRVHSSGEEEVAVLCVDLFRP